MRCDWGGWCTRRFSQLEELTKHLKTHSYIEAANMHCGWSTCSKVFSDPRQLRDHVISEHLVAKEEAPKPKKHCPWNDCEWRCTPSDGSDADQQPSPEALFEHISKAHSCWSTETPERVMLCRWGNCGRFFSDKTKFSEHIKSHAGIKSVVCPEVGCNKHFTNESQMRTHVKRSHENGFECAICAETGIKKSYATVFNLKEHQKIAHQNQEYQCATCSKSYKSAKAYNVHKRRCSGANPAQAQAAMELQAIQTSNAGLDAQSYVFQLQQNPAGPSPAAMSAWVQALTWAAAEQQRAMVCGMPQLNPVLGQALNMHYGMSTQMQNQQEVTRNSQTSHCLISQQIAQQDNPDKPPSMPSDNL